MAATLDFAPVDEDDNFNGINDGESEMHDAMDQFCNTHTISDQKNAPWKKALDHKEISANAERMAKDRLEARAVSASAPANNGNFTPKLLPIIHSKTITKSQRKSLATPQIGKESFANKPIVKTVVYVLIAAIIGAMLLLLFRRRPILAGVIVAGLAISGGIWWTMSRGTEPDDDPTDDPTNE